MPLYFDDKDTWFSLPCEQHTSIPVWLLAVQYVLLITVEPDTGKAPGHVPGGQLCLLVHPWWDGVGLRRLSRVEMFRLPPAPRPTQSHKMQTWQQSTYTALSLLIKHLRAKDWRWVALYHLPYFSFSLSFFFFSLWSWLNLLIPCCGLHAPTFPLINIHFQWGGGAEFTSMTQGTLKYTQCVFCNCVMWIVLLWYKEIRL